MAVTAIAELVAVGAPKDAILNDLKSLDIAISDRRNVLVEAAVK